MNVSAYLFKDGYDDVVDYVEARDRGGGVGDFARARRSPTQSLARIHRNSSRPYPGLSLVYVPLPARPSPRRVAPGCDAACTGRPVRGSTCAAPAAVPRGCCAASLPVGTIVRPARLTVRRRWSSSIRAAPPVVVGGATVGYVIADLPIGDRHGRSSSQRRHRRARRRRVADRRRIGEPVRSARAKTGDRRTDGSAGRRCFGKSVIFLDYQRLGDGRRRGASASRSAIVPARALSPAVGRAADRIRRRAARRVGGRRSCCVIAGAVPDHRDRRAQHGPGARALDHQLDPRAVHGHRARAAWRLRPPDRRPDATISSASWPGRSTR